MHGTPGEQPGWVRRGRDYRGSERRSADRCRALLIVRLVARISVGGAGELYRAHRLLGWERAIELFPGAPSGRHAPTPGGLLARRHWRPACGTQYRPDPGCRDRRAVYFVVMDLLDGTTLAELLDDETRLSAARAVGLLPQVAYALDYAHDAGRPALRSFAEEHRGWGRRRVTVSGLALPWGSGRDVPYQRGEIVGTLAYLAPETILGIGDGDTADQYALGVLAYELLVGHLPFSGDDPTTVMEAHTDQPPPRPREDRPELTEAVEQVLLRSLRKDADDRYASATEFAVALRSAIEVRPARPDPQTPRVTMPRQPDPWTSLQAELREKPRTQVVEQAPSRARRRAFLAATSTLIAGAGVVPAT